MKRKLLIWELIGIIFISGIGSLLHFTYEWSGNSNIAAVFSAVNESTWEHLKMGFWPALLFMIIEYKFLKDSTYNFFTAKAISIYLIPILIIVLFYSYMAILGHDSLIADIALFIISVAAGQLVSYKIMTSSKFPRILEFVSVIAILLLAALFWIFTFNTPHSELFKDPVTGKYGITK